MIKDNLKQFFFVTCMNFNTLTAKVSYSTGIRIDLEDVVITMPSFNVLNVLLIQIQMAFYYLHLLLSMVHIVHSSRDHLKLI